MIEVTERAVAECPRCGSFGCEENGFDLLCPNCLFHEPIPSFARTGDHPSATPSDAMAPPVEDQEEPETLGEFIEQVPADLENWDLSLNQERILRMNAVQNNEQHEKPVTVFDVMIAEEGKNGKTYWHNLGVAFPLSKTNGLSLKLHMFPGLRLKIMESIRPVGAARVSREEATAEDTPF